MNVQQAPSPVQADLAAPETVASVKAHSTKGGTTQASAATTTTVRAVFAIELKRFRRNQSRTRATVPSTLPGTRSPEPVPRERSSDVGPPATMVELPTSIGPAWQRSRRRRWIAHAAWSALHQGDAAVVPIHEPRAGQIHCHEDCHDGDHRLDFLGRLLHDRTREDLHQLRVRYGGAQRGALDDIEVLAGQ